MRPSIVPGLERHAPEYTPGEGGWKTEEWSASITTQLKKLAEAALTGGDVVMIADGLCAPDFVGAAITPLNGGIAMDLAVGLELRSHAEKWQDHPKFSSGLKAALELAGLALPLERADFKVVSIEENPNSGMDVTLKFHFAGQADSARRQLDGEWYSEWKLVDEKPRLVKINGAGNSVASKVGGFSDITHSVLGASYGFSEQFYHGQDHWAGRIEMLMGLDIGGWQGLSVADVNGDGLEDIYVCQPGGLPNRLFVQRADGKLSDRSVSAGVDFLDSCHGSLLVDLDNDGDQDLALGTSDGLLVLANDGVGGFTVRAAMILPAAVPYSISAADHDADGDLDLYVCCYNRRPGVNRHHVFARPVPYHDANNGGRNALFSNDGEWRFTNATSLVGMDSNNRRFSYASSWEDYDSDGDLDLYVANDFGRNNLYRNVAEPGRPPRYEDVAESAGVVDIGPGMSTSWADYDNDGHPDLYVGNMFSSAGNRVTGQQNFQAKADEDTRESFRRHARGNSLFKNSGDGTFADVGEAAGVSVGRWAWSSKFVDFDSDGYEDIVVANGFISQDDTGDL